MQTQLCKLNECNPENLFLLEKFRVICKTSKGLTKKSVEAFCNFDIRLFLQFISSKSIKEVNHFDVDDFFQYCAIDRKNGDQALARKYTALNSFYNTLIMKGYLETINPLMRVDKTKIRKKVRRYLEKGKIDIMIDYCKSHKDKRGAAIFSLFFSSGIRLSELIQLDRKNIPIEDNELIVLGKGDKERRCLIIGEDYHNNILDYINSRTDEYPCLFLSKLDQRLSDSQIQRDIKEIGVQCNISDNVHPHLLRHSFAMYLHKNGMQLDKIQVLLGHDSISTTQIYAHTSLDDVKTCLKELRIS